jgi:hypothetical protein
MNPSSYLVLDTNVWVYTTRLLSTAMGAAVLYSLHQTGRRLALPEVIEEEIKKHTLKRGTDAVEAIKENYRLIEQLMGARDDYRVPSETDLSARVKDRLNELGSLVHRTSFTLKNAKAALSRVLEESPPNGYKNQQFKDSAIWEAILDLARQGDVDFVTEDKAFFRERNPNLGLADNLKSDCKAVSGTIRVYYELVRYLQSVREELPPLDHREIAEEINRPLREQLTRKATDKGYELGELVDHKISAFLTEKSNVIAVEFELSYSTRGLKLPGSQSEIEVKEIVKGDCACQLTERSVSDIQLESIHLEDGSGQKIPGYTDYYLRVDSVLIGRKTVPYTLREPINR